MRDQYDVGHCTCCNQDVPLYVARHHARRLARRTIGMPTPCDACNTPVHRWGGQNSSSSCVHHLDDNPWNNALTNIVIMHQRCHARHHHLGAVRSVETRDKLSARAQTRAPASDLTRAKISARLRGKPKSPEHRAAIARHRFDS